MVHIIQKALTEYVINKSQRAFTTVDAVSMVNKIQKRKRSIPLAPFEW